MTKRQLNAQVRAEEEMAVRMYLRGDKLAAIKRATGVPGFIVRGLVTAYVIRNKM